MSKRSMQIGDANWQSSFLYQFRCFQNRNLGSNFQTLFARKRPLLFTWKWMNSTLSFILLEKNDNIFSPWGSVFPRSPFFLRSRVQVWVRFWDDAQNDEQFQKIQKQGAHIIMMDLSRHFKQVNWGIPWIASYVRKKNYLSKGK